MKKILAMALSVILIASLAISGTVAYLTDDESEVNVMTVGKVNVKLWEEQRKNDGERNPDGTTTKVMNGDLETFEDDKNLVPSTGLVNTTDNDWNMSDEPNYLDKIVRVQNTGESPAFVRVFIAIPAELEREIIADQPALIWHTGENFVEADEDADKDFVAEFVDKGVPFQASLKDKDGNNEMLYNIYSFTRSEALLPGEKTAAVMAGFYLNSLVDYNDETNSYFLGDKTVADNEIQYNFDGDIRIPVYVQAIQSAGFEDADEAFYTAGLNDKNPWANNKMTETDEPGAAEDADALVIGTAADLYAFAARVNGGETFSGQTVKLAGNINLRNQEWTPIGDNSKTEGTFMGTFDGQGHTISNLTISRANDDDSWCVGLFGAIEKAQIKNLNIKNVNISNGYAYTGAVAGYAVDSNITNANVSGDIKIEDNAYVGGITGYGNANIIDCSVIGNDGSYIKTPGNNKQTMAGGIIGYREVGSSTIDSCVVKNLEISAYAGAGSITGLINTDCSVKDCVVEDVTVTATRTSGRMTAGYVSGNYASNTMNTAVITGNSFTNVNLVNNTTTNDTYNELYGAVYSGNAAFRVTASDNTIN